MDIKEESNVTPSKAVSIIYFSFLVLTSSIIMWVFICIAIKLAAIPKKQLPESLLYPFTFGIYPAFMQHIVGKCLKTIPLGKYTYQIGLLMIILLFLFLVKFIGILDFTLIPGALLK